MHEKNGLFELNSQKVTERSESPKAPFLETGPLIRMYLWTHLSLWYPETGYYAKLTLDLIQTLCSEGQGAEVLYFKD